MMHLVEYYGRQNVKRIVLMAGAFFDAGNITPYAELNAHCDPFALIQLLNLGTPVTMVPLDVCRKIQLTRSTVRAYLDVSQSKLTKLIVKSHMKYMDFHYEREGIDGCFPHDTIAVLVAIMPQWFSHIHARIRVGTAPERRGETRYSSTIHPTCRSFSEEVLRKFVNCCAPYAHRRSKFNLWRQNVFDEFARMTIPSRDQPTTGKPFPTADTKSLQQPPTTIE
jgi:inosine-uridine nucleoside N-ribohydrolase